MTTETVFMTAALARPTATARGRFPAEACMKAFEIDGPPVSDIQFVEQVAVPMLQSACVAIFDEAMKLAPPTNGAPSPLLLRAEKYVAQIEEHAIGMADSADGLLILAASYEARGLHDECEATRELLRRLSAGLNADHLNCTPAQRDFLRERTAPQFDSPLSVSIGSNGFAAAVSLANTAQRELSDQIALAATRNPPVRPSYPSKGEFIRILADIYRKAFGFKTDFRKGHPMGDRVEVETKAASDEPGFLAPASSHFYSFVKAVYNQIYLDLDVDRTGHLVCPEPTTIAGLLRRSPVG